MNGHDHHHHEHNKDCSCGHDHTSDTHGGDGGCVPEDISVVYTEYHLHDEARVVSGRLTVTGEYGVVKEAVSHALKLCAKAIIEAGGIVGHIKASCQVKTIEVFSVTESDVSVKAAPQQEIRIILAAIVFLIDPEKAEELAHKALEAVRDSTRNDFS
ncbi:MAG: hypothetical protein GX936_07060 [Clostridiales bacterium]|jgi:hypothetical protein|nr:hypothetical protein [Clostridiales bacterium]